METNYNDTAQEDLRRWIAKRLKKEVPQPIWEKVQRNGYVDQVLNPNDSYRREDLLDDVKELLQFAHQMVPYLLGFEAPVTDKDDSNLRSQDEKNFIPPSAAIPIYRKRWQFIYPQRQDETNVIPLSVDNPVSKRGDAFALYLAKMAAEDSMVKQFRQRVLGGATLSYKEAVDFITSPAAAVFSLEWFEERGVPFIGHKARVLEGKWWPSKQHSEVLRGDIQVKWDGGELVSSFESVAPLRSLSPIFLHGRWVTRWKEIEVLDDSVLGVLWNFAQRMGRFPEWRACDIPMFVLMGVARIVGQHYLRQDESRSSLYHPITINVPPWFSAENVGQLYKSFKKDFPTKPQPSPRRLALFEFVMKQPEVTVPGEGGIPQIPSWAALFRSWNGTLPAGHEWHYDDRRNFRRDFLKAFEQIVNYSY